MKPLLRKFRWDDYDIEFLCRNYPNKDNSIAWFAGIFQRTERAVKSMVGTLGLKRSYSQKELDAIDSKVRQKPEGMGA